MTYVAPSRETTVTTEDVGGRVRLTDGRVGKLVALVGQSATVDVGGRVCKFRAGGLTREAG